MSRNSNLNIIPLSFAVVCFLYCIIFKGYIFFSSVGLAFSLYIFTDFVYKLGKVFPIKEFIVLIASLQWIVGAKISFSLGKTHHKYYMYVEEDVYMNYVVPGVIAMAIGLYLFKTKLSVLKIKQAFMVDGVKRNKSIAIILIAIGFGCLVFGKVLPIPSLAFALFLGNLLLYVGVSYLFFLTPHLKWLLVSITLGITLITSLNAGMFHDLLLIASFFGFLVIPKNFSFLTKIGIVAVGFLFIYMLQIVKKDFREIIWNSDKEVNAIEVFWEIVEKEFLVQDSGEDENVVASEFQSKQEEQQNADANNRLNQGWIISRVMDNIPKRKPFLGGRTIVETLEASLLPRFLAPKKAGTSQGLKNFKEITGLPLSKNASMGLSLVAEFYANFGIIGGWIAMLVYGMFLSFLIHLIINYFGKSSPIMILWFILFFFQVVKAETDFIKIFNHLVKSIMFFIIANYGLKQINIRLFRYFNPNTKAAEANA